MYTFDTTNTETWGQFFSSLNLVDSVTFWLIEYDNFWSQMLRDIYFLLPRHSPWVPWVTIEDIWPHCDVTSMSRGQGSHRGQQPQLTQVFQTCPLTTKGMKAPPECPSSAWIFHSFLSWQHIEQKNWPFDPILTLHPHNFEIKIK